MTPIYPNQFSSMRPSQRPTQTNQPDGRRPSDPLDAYGGEKGGDKRTRHQSMASSSAAKKVMDWFRRKSMAKASFAAPVSSTSEHAGSAQLDADFPGGQGVLVPTAAALRVEDSVGPSSSSETSEVGAGNEEKSAQPIETESPAAKTPTIAEKAPTIPTLAPPIATRVAEPIALNRQSSARRKTARPSTAGGVMASITSPIMAKPTQTRLPANENLLRTHNGVVDQSALTNKPAAEVMDDVLKVLFDMGIEIKRESDFKLRCTRPNRRKAAAGPGFSPASRSGSMASFSMAGGASTGYVSSHPMPGFCNRLLTPKFT